MNKQSIFYLPILLIISIFFYSTCQSCTKRCEYGSNHLTQVSTGRFRHYNEAFNLAKQSISFLQDSDTKSGIHRVIDDSFVIGGKQTKSGIQDSLAFVFNYSDSAGFAIISAIPSTVPILSVVERGHLTPGKPTGVPGFDAYLSHILSELEAITHDYNNRGPGLPYSYWQYDTTGTRVFPLLGETRWGQNGTYGAFCPNGICGCFATALGQIMKYFSRPSQFTASCGLSNNYPIGTVIYPQWDSIRFHNTNHSNSQVCSPFHDEISALLRDIGEVASSTYLTTVTSTYNSEMVPTLQHYGFTSSTLQYANTNTIISSLNSSSPVFMFSPGHFFVADGYQDYTISYNKYEQVMNEPGYFITQSIIVTDVHAMHINWGWDGECNGYFAFGTYNTALAVSYDTSTNNMSHNYTPDAQMVYNIQPVN